MALCIVVVNAVPDRVRGYLRSSMLEIEAGVYVSTLLTKRARDLIWEELLPFCVRPAYAIMVWEDSTKPARFDFLIEGAPKKHIRVLDGLPLLYLPDK